ncbi:hypothetical protein D3C71_1807900 [compost metagenome]
MLLAVSPAPEKALVLPAPILERAMMFAAVEPLSRGRLVMPALSSLSRSTLEEDFCVAVTRSTICTVTMSPTRRARWSSKAGR